MQSTLVYNSDKSIKDIEIILENKKFLLLGAVGKQRELSLLNIYKDRQRENVLPVFLGLGLGYALEKFLSEIEISLENQQLPICVVDKENFLEHAEYSKRVEALLSHPLVTFIHEKNAQNAIAKITQWQQKHNDIPLFPILNSQYTRIDASYYKTIKDHLDASYSFDFWSKVRKKRFQGKEVKLLLITSKYFLMGEIVSACERLGLKHKLLVLEDDTILQEEFVKTMLEEVLTFDPDAIFTLNHLGVDRDGVLTDLLARLELPLASWFLDNPHLVLYSYPKLSSDWLTIFTYDADNIESLNDAGYDSVHYLPLGTDPDRFHPRNKDKAYDKRWIADVSFVGNSMDAKVVSAVERSKTKGLLVSSISEIAKKFDEIDSHSVKECLQSYFPHIYKLFDDIEDIDQKLAYEAAITWEATRQYRRSCVEQLLDFSPLIVGNKEWKENFAHKATNARYYPELSYYSDLPLFYTHSKINFNSTSKQMKNAFNQRVLDVPVSGAFVLTDYRSQMDSILEDKKEVISYRNVEEIPELVAYYLKNESQREKIVKKGRERILSEHTWEHRVKKIIETLKKRYR